MATTQPETIQVTCANPQCRRAMKMRNPGKAGVYRINCPFCKQSFSIRLVDKPDAPEEPAEKKTHPTEAEIPTHPSPATAGKKVPEPPETPGKQPPLAPAQTSSLAVTCPSCSTRLMIGNARPGTHQVQCPKCRAAVTYNGPAGTDNSQKQDNREHTKPITIGANTEMGCIVTGKSPFSKGKAHRLAGRTTIIGRRDPSAPSDIMIDDSTVSRRSASINAEVKAGQLLYTLTVINATNRVTHNGTALTVGSKVYLSFGDTIVMGRTKLIFAKAKDYNLT